MKLTLSTITLCLAGILPLLVLSECQRPAQADMPLHVALAKVCVSESGWASPQDCRGIYAALSNTAAARSVSLRRVLRGYSSRVFDQGRMDRRRWLAHLEAPGAPTGWPEKAVPWRQWGKPKWERVLKVARDIVRKGEIVCVATDWGNEKDWQKWKRPWERIDCGPPETLNIFGRPK